MHLLTQITKLHFVVNRISLTNAIIVLLTTKSYFSMKKISNVLFTLTYFAQMFSAIEFVFLCEGLFFVQFGLSSQDPHCVGRDYKSQMTCNAILSKGI